MTETMYNPSLYRLLHTGNPGDLPFYRSECPPGVEVLELGCGFGRIALELLNNGARVTALDTHDGMLALLREAAASLPENLARRLTVHQGDMRRFSLDTAFDRILIPYNGLLCLLSDDDAIRCLSAAALHLAPDGELLFDIYYVPVAEGDDGMPEDDPFEHIAALYDGMRTIHVFERALPHPDPQRFDTVYRHIIVDETGAERQEEYAIAQRCIYKEDLPALLGRAGLTLVSLTADFRDAPVDDDTDQMVIRARRG